MTVDELGMSDAIGRIPRYLADNAGDTDELRGLLRSAPREVLVLGRSVAAHATEFVNAALGPELGAPVSFAPSSILPGRLDSATLVVAVSLSAIDAPALRAASVAAVHGAPVVVLATGTAPKHDGRSPAVWCTLPEAPRERLSLYAVVAEFLRVLEVAQIARDTAMMLDEAADRARARIASPVVYRSFGEALARRLGRTFPFLVGAPGVGLAAARWWQAEMAANARVIAHAESTAEYGDALLAGFGQSGDVTRQVATLVLLRSASDPPESTTVFAAIEEWLAETVADIVSVEGEGPRRLAQLVDLAVLGDLTSVALAAIEGIDPGPSPVIDRQE